MGKKKLKALANPTVLKPLEKSNGILQVIIETPKGSRNKFAFDPDQRVFMLRKVLPAGMAFPYDFGFLPRTLAADGDPIDVLLLMDEPAYPGVAVRSRLIGVIEENNSKGKTESATIACWPSRRPIINTPTSARSKICPLLSSRNLRSFSSRTTGRKASNTSCWVAKQPTRPCA